ncbi:glycosyl transferase [Photobacterium profundum]|uniref:Glycosyltransferase n=1 Tax=Photobacterium profundum 3TCK TaxID=314280 RepID=Q1Z867_9GAMM|nr:glycosyltransferase [Photobacterium profundum]EAS44646.1 glycosyltransferase [Photobacterium profundum 3TCK]PSV60638.1 glycosyl transferase [Photobacterium profundum]
MNISNKIAVAMSIYKSDSVNFVEASIDSILHQSYSSFDLFIEVDGEVSNELKKLLIRYSCFSNVFINFNVTNLGLAYRLNEIIEKVILKNCYTFLARMDADDISVTKRFEKQVQFLLDNPDISVVGSDVVEITNDGVEIFYKKMASKHEDLSRNIIRKCPFNHPTVMFNLRVFNEDGYRYKSELKNTQDFYLWVDLLSGGKRFANINEPLLKFRIDADFHHRRGFNKAVNDFNSRLYAFKKLNVLTVRNIFHTGLLFILRISPAFIKSLAYKYMR